jgi:hypothetical protein
MSTATAIKTITAFAAAAALCAPAAYATTDLRSPDARDAARAAEESQDLRSPDARDAAREDEVAPPDRPSVQRVERVEVPSTDFAWGDAGIGAATLLALMSLGFGTVLLLERQRRRHRRARTS